MYNNNYSPFSNPMNNNGCCPMHYSSCTNCYVPYAVSRPCAVTAPQYQYMPLPQPIFKDLNDLLNSKYVSANTPYEVLKFVSIDDMETFCNKYKNLFKILTKWSTNLINDYNSVMFEFGNNAKVPKWFLPYADHMIKNNDLAHGADDFDND